MTAVAVTSNERMTSIGDQQSSNEDGYDDKIVQEFSHLLEKSKQLFNGLR